jgi:hypothetical protein
METLKRIDDVMSPDSRNLSWLRLRDGSLAGAYHPTLEDNHRLMADLELPTTVPEHIASAFATARNLWLFGWFHWPFYTVAWYECFRCLEMALRDRWRREGLLPRSGDARGAPALSRLLGVAVRRSWLVDDQVRQARWLAERRRHYDAMIALSSDGRGIEERVKTESSPYVAVLAETVPRLRNMYVHADGTMILLASDAHLALQNVHDIIAQLFK